MHVEIIWVTAAFLSFHLSSSQEFKPLYVMIAPQIVKVGAVTNVFVEVQDNTNKLNIQVNIRVLRFPNRDMELKSSRVILKPDNNFQSIAKMQIPYMEGSFNIDSTEKQYVYLQAQFPDRVLEKIVLVTFQSGYIFVQTDKTIYTPDSTVKYRVFALDTDIKPAADQVVIEVVTPSGIVVEDSNMKPENGTKTGEYTLVSPVSNGIWQIAAKFKNNPHLNYTAEFEVKEYVLPSFEVKLNPERPFFYIDDEKLTVKVQARYLFMKPVEGNAIAMFGIIVNQRKTLFPTSFQRVQIINGQGAVELKRDHIHNIADLINRNMFVSVSVSSESGEMVEAQRGGIYLVKSPYSIQFIRTPKYFIPGMSFYFIVNVKNPDETPVTGLEVLLLEPNTGQRIKTDENGMAKFNVNTDKQLKSFKVKVQTQDSRISRERQGVNEMEAYPYKPKDGSKNYLHIDVHDGQLEIGKTITFTLNLGDSPDVRNQDFTHMILSRGNVLSINRYRRSDNTQIALNYQVTKDMLPSFRFLAYYHVGSSEVVSGSVWVDVKDTCMGKLKVEKKCFECHPSYPISLEITGDPGATVALVAVDKAVYVLNNRGRLTQAKIWDYVERNDIGCMAGSGKDSMGVFYDAGLLFQSDTAGGSADRRDHSCPSAPKRRRRDVNVPQLRNTLVGEFNGTLKKCCMDGLVKNLLEYSCERRSEYIEDGEECRSAFLRCCRERITMEEKAIEKELILARSSPDDSEDIDESFEDVKTRTFFHESWLWDTEIIPGEGVMSVNTVLKDSITTWVITVISMSKDNGICVADPEEIVARKAFFIDLKLPHTAVIKEQIEIKAVIHYYPYQSFSGDNKRTEKVIVDLLATERICSQASSKSKYRKSIDMATMSSYSVTFSIIPLDIGDFDITVRAVHRSLGFTDAVKKRLTVVTNGVLTTAKEVNYILDPARHGKNQELSIQRPVLKDQVPGTEAKTYVTVRGSPLDQLNKQAVSGEGLGRFIQKPYGCAEQNMIRLALPVIATHYLDKTNRWNDVGVDKRTDALHFMTEGVMTELNYYNKDKSFGLFASSRGNIWLIAYVVKIFSMASSLITIDKQVTCGAMEWLIKQQQPDGAFRQGYGNVLYHTASVLIALQEGKVICSDVLQNLEFPEKKAIAYIERYVSSENDPLAVSIALYALVKEGKQKTNIFQKFLINSSDGSHWNIMNNPLSMLEATGYALLMLVTLKDFKTAEPVVTWLQKQQEHMGNYGSSQTTVVVYQALAKYYEEVDQQEYPDLTITLSSTSRHKRTILRYTKGSSGLRHSDKFNAHNNITVSATGTGKGSISFLTLYYAKPVKNTVNCNFELDVKFEKQSTSSSDDGYKLTIEIRFLSTDRSAGMTILDISMMTGFIPDTTDLNRLVNGIDRYIHKYEFDKELSERGSLILYLNKVSNKNKEKIVFKVRKTFNVDSAQPASVSVYEYYSTEKPCVVFYGTEREKGLLDTLCHNDVCLCAEENCPSLIDNRSSAERHKSACDGDTDYVYVAVLDNIKNDNYTFNITKVLKEGTEESITNQHRDFLAHFRCKSKMKLKEGSRYLIMGPAPTSQQQSFWYSLTAQTWLENWTTTTDSQGHEIGLIDKITDCY